MGTQELAAEFTNLCKAGKFEEAGHKFWADDIVSIEAMTGEGAVTKGVKAVDDKGKTWAENHQVHGAKIEGPFMNGDQFALRFEFDLTPKGKDRMMMREMGLYTVRNGKITEERFFY